MVYARKKHGGASCYLIAPDNVADFIRYVTWAQGVANCFCNREEQKIKNYLDSIVYNILFRLGV